MLIKRATDIPSSEITDEKLYRNRREFIRNMSAVLGVSAVGTILPACASAGEPAAQQAAAKAGKYDTSEAKTPEKYVTGYNNYYEFGTGKDDPARSAGRFRTSPWSITVEGMVKKPATYALDDLLKGIAVEDRVYRMRCVEAWSMVIPWHGYPLASIIKKLEPTPSAKYVEFQTLLDPNQMPEQRYDILHWPYTEGLRLDEAMNELAFFASGVYGKVGPNQNGAPIRLIVPWKYGFKGAKAIVKIRFTDKQPLTAWAESQPREYGFYANVNPQVDHPRWSQKTERRLGTGLLGGVTEKQTLMFNGYSDYVASLYTGLDLRKNY